MKSARKGTHGVTVVDFYLCNFHAARGTSFLVLSYAANDPFLGSLKIPAIITVSFFSLHSSFDGHRTAVLDKPIRFIDQIVDNVLCNLLLVSLADTSDAAVCGLRRRRGVG